MTDGRAVVVAVHHQRGDPWRFYVQLFQVTKDTGNIIHDFGIRGAFGI